MADQIKIDKGVPLHDARRRWPFASMNVGDSFLVPADVTPAYAANLAGAANRQYPGMRFSGRQTPEGYRVWRIA